MAAGKDKTSWMVGSGFGLLLVLILGAGLGYFFAGDVFTRPAHTMMIALALGFVWALFLLHWVDLLAQNAAFSADPVPNSLDLSDRAAVKAHVEKLTGGGIIVGRARRLLTSWANGADAQQLISLASFQSQLGRQTLQATAAFALILIVGAMWQGGNTALAWGAFVLVAVTLYARQNLLSRIDHYLETQLLSRLPGGALAAAAPDLGRALGDAVSKAFKEYLPQPEQMAQAINQAVENANRQAAEAVTKASSQSAEVVSKLASALNEHVQQVQGAANGWSEQLGGVLTQHAQNLQAALDAHAEHLQSASGSWTQEVGGVLAQHADGLQAANQQLATHLDKIAELAGSIENVLHVQQTVDNTVKAVMATDEFKATMQALKTHVEESDKLLREMARPRKIRLVEAPTGAAKSEA